MSLMWEMSCSRFLWISKMVATLEKIVSRSLGLSMPVTPAK